MTESKGSSFWGTLPGLITAVAGMVTAIAILVTTLATLPGAKPQDSNAPTGPDATSPSLSPVGSDGSTGPSPSSGAASTQEPSPPIGSALVPVLFYAVRVDPVTGADNADLYSVDPSTGAERRLTDDPKPDSYPAWSPDGTRIVFDSRRVDGNRNVWILEVDGSFTALTNDARDDGYPAWSPDGTQVSWAAGTAGEREIWVMNAADGSGARRLTTGADDFLPSWSSAGLIAFERRIGSESEIWVVDPAGGGAAARITAGDGGGSDPAWSPDGNGLAFARRIEGINRIFVAAADGQTGLRPLTPESSCDCEEPSWSPDGSQIVYVGPAGGSAVIRPILVISAAGGSARRLTTNGLGPSWGG